MPHARAIALLSAAAGTTCAQPFESLPLIPSTEALWHLHAVDFTGDGRPDLAAANRLSNSMSLYENIGLLEFSPVALMPTSSGPNLPDSVDLDGDGDSELAISFFGSGTTIIFDLEMNGTITQRQILSTGGCPAEAEFGDWNNDGLPDLVVAAPCSGLVYFFENDGNGVLSNRVSVNTGVQPHFVEIADFNGDLLLDVAAVNYLSENITVQFGQPDGTLSSPVIGFSEGSGTLQMRSGDMDGDGDIDLITSVGPSPHLYVLENDGTGTFPTRRLVSDEYPEPRSLLDVGDLDADGDIDIVFVRRNDNTINVLTNDGTGNFVLSFSSTRGSGGEAIPVLFDADRDGDLDIAVPNTVSPYSIQILRNEVLSPEPCLADVNGDGLATPADFNAWIVAYLLREPECDQNGDGLCNPSDFNAWVVNFNLGCD